MKHNILMKIVIATFLASATLSLAQNECEAIKELVTSPGSTETAINKLAMCISSLEDQNYLHVNFKTGKTYCTDNKKYKPIVRLANLLIRTAWLEDDQFPSSFCCSEAECQSKCNRSETATCNPEGKPHPIGLIDTTDSATLIKNIASRLVSVENIIKGGA